MKTTMQDKETSDLLGQRKQRLEKVQKIRDLGIDPYPAKSNKNTQNSDIKNNFENYEGKEVTIAGRVRSQRGHGQLKFWDVEDMNARLQLFISADLLAKTKTQNDNLGFEDLELVDIGDIVEAKGIVVKTKTGEISLQTTLVRILTKSIRPLPTDLDDKEERYRRRYLDMTLHPEVRERFVRRSKFWSAIRNFLNSKGFLEINIPVLEHVTGGADANPFVTHYDALNQDFYLRISHELPLKRLLGGGFEKVYDIGQRFRNEGFSDEHLPEHVAMEFYWAYADANDGMQLTKEMYRHIMQELYGTNKFNMKGFEVDLTKDWEILDFVTIIKEHHDIDVFNDSLEKMTTVLKQKGVELDGDINMSRATDSLWKLIRKTIPGPAFLTGVPKFLSPLAKSDPKDPKITQRFHPIIAGSELANAFGELNDPVDQLERFMEQQGLRDSGDAEAHMLDIDFVEMLEYGMPPAVGFGLSERVFWFFEDVTAKEGVPFPQLKHSIDEITKKIYPQINFEATKKSSKSRANEMIDLDKLPSLDLVKINADVSAKFPGIKTGYIVLENVNVEKQNEELEKLKKEISKEVASRYSNPSEIKKGKNIVGFRELYKNFGADPDSTLNSAEALLRRIVQGKGLYNINTVVDTYNVTSAEFEVPMAAYNLDKIDGKIQLRFAKDGDQIIKILETEPTMIDAGELVYADSEGVICMDFNYRDSDRTKITDEANRIIVFADGHEGISEENLKEVLGNVGARLEKFTGGKVVGIGMVS